MTKPEPQTKAEIERELKAEHMKALEERATHLTLSMMSGDLSSADNIYVAAAVLANLIGNHALPDTIDALLRDTQTFVTNHALRTATIRQKVDQFIQPLRDAQ